MNGGDLDDKGDSLKHDVVIALQFLLYDQGEQMASLKGLSLSQLNSNEANILEKPFSKEEVLATALNGLHGD